MIGRTLGRRLDAWEGAAVGRSAYAMETPADLAPGDEAALVARHRARTGHAGPVILVPAVAPSTEAWIKTFNEGRA